jgi:CTD kinase subunit gamma
VNYQILESWRSKRVVDPHKVDEVVSLLNGRTESEPTEAAVPSTSLSRNEVFKRIEEDRERHKRLRERRWVQPVAPQATPLPPPLATFLPLSGGTRQNYSGDAAADEGPSGWARGEELTIDVEFENEWETTSDWNEDDDEAALEENELCFPRERAFPMDVP